jgi:hypothetical protein
MHSKLYLHVRQHIASESCQDIEEQKRIMQQVA